MRNDFVREHVNKLGLALGLVALTELALNPTAAKADWPASSITNLPVCTAPGVQSQVDVTTDGARGVLVTWSDLRNGVSSDIYATHVLDNGSLDPAWPIGGRAVCLASGNQTSPKMVSDGQGGAFIVWQDARVATGSDIYVHHVLPNGDADPAWPIDGLPVCTADTIQSLPQVVRDGAGGAIVVWTDFRSRVDRDVYCQRILSSGILAAGWPVNGLAVCTAPGDQLTPRSCPDSQGNAVFVWGDLRGGVSDIYAQRILGTGNPDPLWPANGSPVCAQAGAQQLAEVASDGAGGVLVAWADFRGGATADVYSAHMGANGVLDPSWPSAGLALCTAPGDQSSLKMTEAGPGGAIVVWMDRRSGSTYDIYAQRVDGAVGGWPADGLLLCAAAGDQRTPVLVNDGYGGAVVAWQDKRTDAGDVYAQHVLASGAVDAAWPSGGVAVSSAANNQQLPAMIADGSGGAILAWLDDRTAGVNDVYAQRIRADGSLGGTVLDVSGHEELSFRLDAPSPNPVRGQWVDLSFALSTPRDASLELWDLQGRRLATQSINGMGRHSTRLPLPERAANGVYFIVLRQGAEAQTRRLTILN